MKILVSDFDKTLFDKDYLININKVNEFVNSGNMFVIATGRNITSLKKEITGKNINYSYLICNDGGIIYDRDLNIIYRKDIDQNTAIKIFDLLENSKYICNAYMDDGKIYTKDNNCVINRIIAKPLNNEKVKDLLDDINMKYPDAFGYASRHWMNIGNSDVNKGSSIKVLERELNEHDIYTIGDNVNDISMNEMYQSFAIIGNKNLEKVSTFKVKNFVEAINILKLK